MQDEKIIMLSEKEDHMIDIFYTEAQDNSEWVPPEDHPGSPIKPEPPPPPSLPCIDLMESLPKL